MQKFRLQRVLDLRRLAEEEARQRLGVALMARLRAEEELAACLREEQRLREEVAVLLGGGRVDAARVQGLGLLLDAAARGIHAQEAEVSRCYSREEEERRHLTAAMSSRKAIDRLREHFEEKVRVEENRRETAVLGEIANTRAVRLDQARRPAGEREGSTADDRLIVQ